MKQSTVSQDERSCTAAILFDPIEATERIKTLVSPGDFSSPMCRWVYQTALDRVDAGEEVDGWILIDLANRHNHTWRDTLSEMLTACPTASNVSYYAKLVKEQSLKRKLSEMSNGRILDPEELRRVQVELEDATESRTPIDSLSAAVIARDVRKNPMRGGIRPGWECLSNAVRRVWPTHLWVIGGYTSTGKSAFSIATILNICEATPGTRVLVCSTEMAKSTYAARMLSNLTGISALSIMLGEVGPAIQEAMNQAEATLSGYQITVTDNAYTPQAMEGLIRQVSPQIVVLDFAQNVRVQKARNVYERMVEVSMWCQEIPKKYNLTMIALSQTDNASMREKSSDLIPTKGGGELAAAADLVLWLERIKETAYLKVSVKKNRHGPTGGRYFEYVRNFTGFEEKGAEFRTP